MALRIRFIAVLAAVVALAGLAAATWSTPATAQETTTVAVGDIWFCDASFQDGVCDTTVSVGDTVVWNFAASTLPHTATDCGASCDAPSASPAWDSGFVDDGTTFQVTFDEVGVFPYRCEIHPTIMRGNIIVEAAAVEPTPDDGDGDVSPTTAPADDGQPTTVPSTGQGAGDTSGSSGLWQLLLAVAAAGVVLTTTGFLVYRRAS